VAWRRNKTRAEGAMKLARSRPNLHQPSPDLAGLMERRRSGGGLVNSKLDRLGRVVKWLVDFVVATAYS
jgi:hypothetical protein